MLGGRPTGGVRGAELVVHGIGQLITCDPRPGDPLGLLSDGAVWIRDGRVVWVGRSGELPTEAARAPRLDAQGALGSPGLVEPHAHLIFAGSRAEEFDQRAAGASYAEIQARGGGILSTVRATRAASDEQLIAGVRARLDRLLSGGVTVCEAKSGYALDADGELRLCGLLERAGGGHPVELSRTLLAHVPPPDSPREQFVRDFAARAIPEAARRGVDAFDVYCDEGAFTLDEARALLVAAQAAGLALRVHAEQFTHTGAAALAAELSARSVEHLEQVDDRAIAQLARAGTVCNLLPGAALTLRLPWPDGRRLIDAGCVVALGTDLNPGSSLTESLTLMMSLACMQMGMSCAEAWIAVTSAAARSVGRADAGRLAPGARGDLVIWDAGDHREVPQHYGVPLARTVIVAGRVAAGIGASAT